MLKIDLVGMNKILYNPNIRQSLGAKVRGSSCLDLFDFFFEMEPGRLFDMAQKLGGYNQILTHSIANVHLHQLDLLIARIQFDCQAQRNRRIHPIIKRCMIAALQFRTAVIAERRSCLIQRPSKKANLRNLDR